MHSNNAEHSDTSSTSALSMRHDDDWLDDNNNIINNNNNTNAVPSDSLLIASALGQRQMRALWDYEATSPDELSFAAYDLITVIEEDESYVAVCSVLSSRFF